MDNLIAMRADGEISKEKFGELRQKAESELATLNEELDKLNAVSDESVESLDMNAIKAALDEMIDFSGPTIDENIIEKFVSRITPIDNGHYRWDLNFTQNKKQAIIGSVEGRKGKATADIKEYGENDEHSHRTYDKSIQFSASCYWANPFINYDAKIISIGAILKMSIKFKISRFARLSGQKKTSKNFFFKV